MNTIRAGLKLLILAIGLASLPIAANAATLTMKIAHAAAPGDPRDLGAHKLADLLNASNVCDIRAQVYPNSVLGGSNSQLQQVQNGAIEASLLPASFAVGIQPLLGIMDLEFFWPQNPQLLLEVERSKVMDELLATTESKGIVSINIWPTGYKEWLTTRPLRTLKDFKGLIARVMPSQVLADGQTRLGAQNVSMDFGDLYTALQTGTVEATHNPIALLYSMKFYEVAKYLTMTNDGNLDQVFMVSKIFWDKLTPECQAEVRKAAQSASDVTYHSTYALIPKALEAFKKAGVEIIHITPEQREAMVEATRGNRDFYVKLTGKQGQHFLDAFEAEIKKVQAEHPDAPAFSIENASMWAH